MCLEYVTASFQFSQLSCRMQKRRWLPQLCCTLNMAAVKHQRQWKLWWTSHRQRAVINNEMLSCFYWSSGPNSVTNKKSMKRSHGSTMIRMAVSNHFWVPQNGWWKSWKTPINPLDSLGGKNTQFSETSKHPYNSLPENPVKTNIWWLQEFVGKICRWRLQQMLQQRVNVQGRLQRNRTEFFDEGVERYLWW